VDEVEGHWKGGFYVLAWTAESLAKRPKEPARLAIFVLQSDTCPEEITAESWERRYEGNAKDILTALRLEMAAGIATRKPSGDQPAPQVVPKGGSMASRLKPVSHVEAPEHAPDEVRRRNAARFYGFAARELERLAQAGS
jgi:hypothetical protein